ncbi:MAG: spore coat protein CotJB [Halanaerobiaceae bacterium]
MKKQKSKVNPSMLKEIMELQFAVIETALYLNTHPEDRTVLDLHNDYARRLERIKNRYQEKYGPLTIDYPEAEYPWQWIDEPWPWDINY